MGQDQHYVPYGYLKSWASRKRSKDPRKRDHIFYVLNKKAPIPTKIKYRTMNKSINE